MSSRAIILTLILPLLSGPLMARTPLFRYGLEWGFTPMVYETCHLNYLVEEGYRVDDSSSDVMFTPNAVLLAGFGVNVSNNISLGIYSGYAGLSEENRVIPLSFRATWFPKGVTSDGMLYYADVGTGFHIHISDRIEPDRSPATLVGIGTGYHFSLTSSIGLDLQIGFRESFDHALILDPDGSGYISGRNIRRNNAAYSALNMSIALTF